VAGPGLQGCGTARNSCCATSTSSRMLQHRMEGGTLSCGSLGPRAAEVTRRGRTRQVSVCASMRGQVARSIGSPLFPGARAESGRRLRRGAGRPPCQPTLPSCPCSASPQALWQTYTHLATQLPCTLCALVPLCAPTCRPAGTLDGVDAAAVGRTRTEPALRHRAMPLERHTKFGNATVMAAGGFFSMLIPLPALSRLRVWMH
jgi:hypothetical protein